MSELTDACEALTLDKEQLALENEDLQASRLLRSQCARALDTSESCGCVLLPSRVDMITGLAAFLLSGGVFVLSVEVRSALLCTVHYC